MGRMDPLRKARPGHCPGFPPIPHGKFFQDVSDMTGGGAAADGQPVGNLLIGLADREQCQDLALPSCQTNPSVLARHGVGVPSVSDMTRCRSKELRPLRC
jgi:hypothetical protein